MHLGFTPTSFLVVALAVAGWAAAAQQRVPDIDSQREPERRAQPRREDRRAETVDGRRWISSDDGHFVIDLPPGLHTVEVVRSGLPTYRRQVVAQEGESTSLNVSLIGQ